jgi:hypothetical protein
VRERIINVGYADNGVFSCSGKCAAKRAGTNRLFGSVTHSFG